MNTELLQVTTYIKEQLQRELMLQKHIATEDLYNSIDIRLTDKGNSIIIEGWTEDYGAYVDRGRKPGGKKVPISALIEWIRIKGFATEAKKIKGIAFAIQKTIFKEGIPTKGSQQLAPRRKDWISGTLERKQFDIKQRITFATHQEINLWIDNTIQKVKSTFV